MGSDETATAEDAFAALGSRFRLTILQVLDDAATNEAAHLPFMALYERLDVGSTSRLSYHLETLEGPFVRKSDRGYVLTQAGERVVRAIRAGAYSNRPRFEATSVPGECPVCASTGLTAHYRDAALVVECPACEERLVRFDLRPAATRGRTSDEILRSCNRRAHLEYSTALKGTCPSCGGLSEPSLSSSVRTDALVCASECSQCGLRLFAPLEVRVLQHPGVTALYWNHDVDTATIPLWDLPAYVGDWETTISETTPLRVAVTVSYRTDTMRLVVDEDLTLSASSRDPTGDSSAA